MKATWDEQPIISKARRDQTFQGTFTRSPRFRHGELKALRVPLKGPLRVPLRGPVAGTTGCTTAGGATLTEPEPDNTALAKPGGIEDALPRP